MLKNSSHNKVITPFPSRNFRNLNKFQTCFSKETNLNLGKNSKRIWKEFCIIIVRRKLRKKYQTEKMQKNQNFNKISDYSIQRKGFTGTEGAWAGRVWGPIGQWCCITQIPAPLRKQFRSIQKKKRNKKKKNRTERKEKILTVGWPSFVIAGDMEPSAGIYERWISALEDICWIRESAF